jgi:hypothetical protein
MTDSRISAAGACAGTSFPAPSSGPDEDTRGRRDLEPFAGEQERADRQVGDGVEDLAEGRLLPLIDGLMQTTTSGSSSPAGHGKRRVTQADGGQRTGP